MSYIEQELNDTILNGWRNDKTPDEVSEELVKFTEYVEQTDNLYRQKRRKLKQSKRKKPKGESVK